MAIRFVQVLRKRLGRQLDSVVPLFHLELNYALRPSFAVSGETRKRIGIRESHLCTM